MLLGMEFDRFRQKHLYQPENRAITMTLAYIQPQVIQTKPVVKKSFDVSIVSPEPQEKPLISKKKVMVSVEPEKAIFNEEPETQEEIVYHDSNSTHQKADVEVAIAVDIKKNTPVVRKAFPLYRLNPPPKYPRMARKRGYQGAVVLEVLVNQNGRVGDLRLFTSSGYSILDRKAMESVKVWLFEPGMKGDKKLDMWVRVPVRFELK